MLWVVFEGVDGSGKTTLVDRVSDILCDEIGPGNVTSTREPGGLGVDPTLRELALREPDTMTRQLLMAADARQNYLNNVEPYLEDPEHVTIQDRGQWSALAYSGMDDPLVESLGHGGRIPDLYVYVDTPAETCRERACKATQDDLFDPSPLYLYQYRKSLYEALVASNVTDTLRVRGDGDTEAAASRVVWRVLELL